MNATDNSNAAPDAQQCVPGEDRDGACLDAAVCSLEHYEDGAGWSWHV